MPRWFDAALIARFVHSWEHTVMGRRLLESGIGPRFPNSRVPVLITGTLSDDAVVKWRAAGPLGVHLSSALASHRERPDQFLNMLLGRAALGYDRALEALDLTADSIGYMDAAESPAQLSTLTADQQAAFDLIVKRGLNVYLGGNAGTGKTALLRHCVAALRAKGLRVACTASTGVAAAGLGGTTFHFMFHPSRDFSSFSREALCVFDVIVIDEISLFSASFLDSFDRSARSVRNCHDRPFGGLQVILSGDFLQLRITPDQRLTHRERAACLRSGRSLPPEGQLGATADPPLFKAAVFTAHVLPVTLTSRHRQSDCPEFADALDRLRTGEVTPLVRQCATRASRKDEEEEHHHPDHVHLFPTRGAAMDYNRMMLDLIESEPLRFPPLVAARPPHPEKNTRTHLVDVALVSPTQRKTTIPNNTVIAEAIASRLPSDVARVSRIVVASCNSASDTYVSGGTSVTGRCKLRVRAHVFGADRGTTARVSSALADAVASGNELNARSGKRTAKALRICNSQLTPIDAELRHWNALLKTQRRLLPREARAVFEDEATRVTVELRKGCRVMLQQNLTPTLVNGTLGTVVAFESFSPSKLPTELRKSIRCSDGEKITFDTKPEDSVKRLPVVRFDNGEQVMIPYTTTHYPPTASMNFFAVSVATLPLSVAYGFTVHKVQGITLDCSVTVNLARMWPCPHLVYVALSRVRRPDSLILSHFDPKHVTVDPEAKLFVETLLDASMVLRACQLGSSSQLSFLSRKLQPTCFWKENETGESPDVEGNATLIPTLQNTADLKTVALLVDEERRSVKARRRTAASKRPLGVASSSSCRATPVSPRTSAASHRKYRPLPSSGAATIPSSVRAEKALKQ